jgi:hypothetical protein
MQKYIAEDQRWYSVVNLILVFEQLAVTLVCSCYFATFESIIELKKLRMLL